jgi:hypothetical protein
MRSDPRYQKVMRDLMGDLWFDRFLTMRNLPQKSIRDGLRLVLLQLVLRQHDQIMYEKNDLRRCWFTKEEERYFFQADPNQIWRPAKFSTIMSYLYDLNLIDAVDEADLLKDAKITEEGCRFWQQLEEAYYSS